ncbi:MAG: HD domain-containing protein [Actinobacteria bacterium]|nr:HD domain-containing protein [Actinomycetota bacterium]
MRKNLSISLLGVFILLALYLASRYSYILFHSLAELFSIIIACGIFMLAWNSRKFLDNNYLLFIGIAYLFVAGIDTIHTLAYKGMGVFPGYGSNLATQLWISARFLEGTALIMAPFFINKKLKVNLVFLGYGVAVLLMFVSIFYWKIFPAGYIEGVGLTPFKKISEYVISMILLASVFLLFKKRRVFDPGVTRLLVASIIVTIFSELSFTLYVDVYGIFNMIGHIFKIVSFYLIYEAIIVMGLVKPYSLLFRNLKQSEEELRKHRDHLEGLVGQRTAEIQKINIELQKEVVEHRQTLDALHIANQAYKILSSGNQTLIRATDEHELLREICKIIIGFGKYRFAWIGYAKYDRAKTVQLVAWAGNEVSYLKRSSITWADTEFGRHPAGIAVRTRNYSILTDIKTDSNYSPWRKDDLEHGYMSIIALPLIVDSNVLGSLVIYASEKDAFSQEEVKVLTELADDLAFGVVTLRKGVDLKRTREELERNLKRLQKAMECTIQAMATTLEKRDLYTAGHQVKVEKLACRIGEEIGVSSDQIAALRLAAGIHDIGKISIPAEILSKPCSLTEAEMSLIKSHPQVGYDILKTIEFPWPIADIVLQHHERLNGSGYPRGLTGNKICLEARIIAVADVIEAMSSHRPYRPALGIDDAIKEISQNKAVLYDPNVVNACVGLITTKGFTFE